MPQLPPFLRLLMHPSQLVHLLCLAALSIVIYENTAQGNLAFMLPVLFMGFSLAAAGMYRLLSRRALIADAIASLSITGAISILVTVGPVTSMERALLNVLILIGAIAIAVQIRINSADRRK
ncbi:hypothetical protein J5J83_08545 [Azoarcus sp. L1K30]|uniref:hypothetical protein n=1 Tax=Azoarcus sp. L1K30 TaxID=2820277 RepID=UPI001B820E8F|nr:hypothetical protein [Azoarcus sp. L1K30]MBR0566163.1 hypothetical protein [Azoarcus sp. L1K30]